MRDPCNGLQFAISDLGRRRQSQADIARPPPMRIEWLTIATLAWRDRFIE